MILNLITRAQVKTHLGISETTYDSQIDAMIPVVSSDVRRILNNPFTDYTGATFSSGESKVYIPAGAVLGQVIYSPYFPEGTYLTAYDPTTTAYSTSAAATGTASFIYKSILISQIPTISKMVWYRISTANTESAGAEKLQSVSYGPVSKTYAPGEINRQYNYPQTLIDDLGPAFARVG